MTEQQGEQGQRRVLLADDDEALGRAFQRALGRAGFDVELVQDGNAAVEAVGRARFDVILSDIRMPGTTGIELLRAVRTRDLDVPVVLMTGNPAIGDAIEALELGALQYLTKPFPLERVVSVLERACKLHRLAILKRDAFALQGREVGEAGDLISLGLSFDRALESMWMAYQPIVSLGKHRPMAYEALMRTSEPALPNPGAVIDAAQRLGRLNDLGRRVRSLVAESLPDAPRDALVFVNLHARDLLDPELCSESAPLSSFARRVVLEITERAALDNVKDYEARVRTLRDMGYRIAIDDMGAGYAGLTSFTTLEPEFVKLDMSLIRHIHTSDVRQKLVASMITLCGEMEKGIIAEGIELADERDQLEDLGCDWMQGYLFAKPSRPFPNAAWR